MPKRYHNNVKIDDVFHDKICNNMLCFSHLRYIYCALSTNLDNVKGMNVKNPRSLVPRITLLCFD